MKKVNDDPLLEIFKHSSNKDEYIEEIDCLENIPKFFQFISSDKTPEDSKIGVIENLLILFKKNRYILEYFSSFNNKSLYLYLFDLFISNNSSEKLKASILNLVEELILCLEVDKKVYECLFQNISKIYYKEETSQEGNTQNLYYTLKFINTLLEHKKKIIKPRNFFALSGKGKFVLDLKDKKLNIGYCMSFIINFKIGQSQKMEGISNLISVKFSNNTCINVSLKERAFLIIKDGKQKEKMVKGLPQNEFVVLVVNLIVEENNLQVYALANGENSLSPIKYNNNLDLKKDTFESIEFFENFYGEVTSISMLLQKEKAKPTMNSAKFLPIFKQFFQGFHKEKELKIFLDILSNNNSSEGQNLKEKISFEHKLVENVVFIITSFSYYSSSWDNIHNKEENKRIDDYFGNHTVLIEEKNNSIRNHRFQHYQKKIYLVCDISNFLPIGEMFLVYPQLLTEDNLELFLQIIEKIIYYRKYNAEVVRKDSFFKVLCLFIEKFPNQIFTERILNCFINIGEILFKNNIDKLTKAYFKHILMNEKILSKYPINLQIKFWNHLLKFCQRDSKKLEKFLKMDRICLILRFYDKNKYKEICCKNHLDMFKTEFRDNCNIMEPSIDKKISDIWKIIDLIINSQKPSWALPLFKLLILDLSPCLTKFIVASLIKTSIIHEDKNNKIDDKNNPKSDKTENNWFNEFIQEMNPQKCQTIIINAFIHSLPDVRIDILKLIYKIYQSLISLNKEDEFLISFNMMKKYLLPQKMFYEKTNDKEILVINDNIMEEYRNNIIMLFIYWSIHEQLIEKEGNISFDKNVKFDKSLIKNSDIFEIIFEFIKQIEYDIKIILKFFEILKKLTNNLENCDKLLYNYKIFLLLINLVYRCYELKIEKKENCQEIENCLSLGKKLLSTIYINDLIYKVKKFLDENYTFNEISLLFLWGDKIIFENGTKNNKIKDNVISFIGEVFEEILSNFKIILFPVMKLKTTDNIKENFIKCYYKKNYLIFIIKLFQFSFEFPLDLKIYSNKLKSIFSNNELMTYNNAFLSLMRIENSKEKKTVSSYWKDYKFFEEIYFKINYMWKKEYLFKDFQISKFKNSNKVKKYTNILNEIILNKDKRNLFKKELEFLTMYFSKENNYDIFEENKDKDSFVEILQYNDFSNISIMKYIQISFLSMLLNIISKDNEEEFKFWLKELKQFIIFIIIASSNLIIKEKEDKESAERKFYEYVNLQDQCSYIIYICLHFLFEMKDIISINRDKYDKTLVSIFTLCCVILRYNYDYRKKNKINKKFNIGYKYNINDLSGSSVFILFDNVKNKKKENEKNNEKDDNTFLNFDKINVLLNQDYDKNIIKALKGANWKESYNQCNIKDTINEQYFPIKEYKNLVEQRITTIKKIYDHSNTDSINSQLEYYDSEILKLLPRYEKKLIHYSNNLLEKNLKRKNLYKTIKKNLFLWNGFWSNRALFYKEHTTNNNNNDNDSFADKNNVSTIKYKLINHYTKSFMKPLLVPILDMDYYLPDFAGFNPVDLFNHKNKILINMDLDKIKKKKEESTTKGEEVDSKENYLKKIYIKSNSSLADKLFRISDSLDFEKEREFIIFNEEKELKNNQENNEEKKENEENKNNEENKDNDKNKTDEENQENKNEEKESDKNYYLSCLVKASHHIKGVCFIDEDCLDFKVFFNQKNGNSMIGVNIGFTDKDHDYNEDRKTCYGSYFMFHKKDNNLCRISINYSDISLILLKRYYYKNTALEIFTVNNKSYYFNFKYEEDREKFINKIMEKFKEPKTLINDYRDAKDSSYIIGYSIQPKLFKDKRKYTRKQKVKTDKSEEKKNIKKISKTIKEWSKWKINNFSFLMWMNFFSNRSYNDISQYPIFPWIITDYEDPLNIEQIYYDSSLLYMNNSNETRRKSRSENSAGGKKKKKKKEEEEEEYDYRDLKLPMGMLEINEESKKRKKDFIESYKTLKEDKEEFEGRKPYYYGTNYSNPIYVCNFLMRLFPFTHISIELQGSKLDHPDRLFLSVIKSFSNSITQKTDIRELIPEFFYLPEMFLNINDINLGKKDDNSIVYNVNTPCKNNAYSFIDIMKRIFENDRISLYLNNWIDLIFGYKARGKEAENAKNIFTEASYQENVDLKKDESLLKYAEFGLIPNQIMLKECQKREKKRDIRKDKELTEYNLDSANKLRVTSIKHDSSNDKNMKNSDNIKSKLLKAEILNKDRIIMLYDNNTIIESKISSNSEDISYTYKINDSFNKINKKYASKIKNKIIKFCNFGRVLIQAGFYDGRFEVIYFEDKIEKKRNEYYPFNENEPIISMNINEDETVMVLGNTIGNIAIYKIDIENDIFSLSKKRFHQMSPISDININNDLNLFASSSIDGFINLYTLPLCKLVRSIHIFLDKEKYEKCNYVFLSESSLPSIIIISQNIEDSKIYSYSINGQFLTSAKEDKNLLSPLKIKDLNSFEYLVYYNSSEIYIRNLPSLSMQIIVQNIANIRSLCINEDITAIYGLNEDGTQILAIRD